MSSSTIKKKLTPYPIIRQPEHEDKRQIFRKDRILSSRFMDNYYNPTLHKKFFMPNGLYLIKK